ncbi:MAG: guanylate kinase [Christensenellales bacterium]|jgi:guanylate kinase
MRKGRLVLVSAPSGTGKGTVIKKLLALRDDTALSVSWTTRQPRPGEEDGVHYHFRTEDEFQKLVESGGFLEYAGIFERRYGTPAQAAFDAVGAGKMLILEIDIQGALQVMAKEGDTLSIFLLPPSMAELKRRLESRGTETPEKVASRFAAAYEELKTAHKYKYCVINDDVDTAAGKMSAILGGGGEEYLTQNYLQFIKTLQEEKA